MIEPYPLPASLLPFREAVDKEPLEGGAVFLASADYHLLVDEGPTMPLAGLERVHQRYPLTSAEIGAVLGRLANASRLSGC